MGDLRRLSVVEYENTVRYLLRDDAASGGVLPADVASPFDNDSGTQVPSKGLIEGLELAARDAVKRLMANAARRDMVVGCIPAGPADADCFRSFVTRFGRAALRRPLTGAEVDRFATLGSHGAAAGDFYAGVDAALMVFLQHPEMVYRIEIGVPVPGKPDVRKLTSWEMATRLSYMLWSSPPDEALLDRAESGGLDSVEGVREAVTAMLEDDRARGAILRLHGQWFGYDSGLQVKAGLGPLMEAETDAVINRVIFEQGRPWQDLFRMEETFVNDGLAKHYKMLPLPGAGPAKWTSYGSSGRRGILSHGTLLSVGNLQDVTSTTKRGKAVREGLLCQIVPDPPENAAVDDPLPATAETPCKEQRYLGLTKEGTCSGACHTLMEPIGLGLERFDHQGKFRTKNSADETCTAPISGQGNLDGVPFSGPKELSDLLLASDSFNRCVVKHVYQYAVGRSKLEGEDDQAVDAVAHALGGARVDFRFNDLVIALATTDGFRHRRAGQP